MQGFETTKSQRERNLINVTATGGQCQPLGSTLSIFDKNQCIGRTAIRYEGRVGCLSTTSSMFSFGTASTLTTADLAKLMGHNLDELILDDLTENQFRHMLGMSVHKAVAGYLMLGMIGSLCPRD